MLGPFTYMKYDQQNKQMATKLLTVLLSCGNAEGILATSSTWLDPWYHPALELKFETQLHPRLHLSQCWPIKNKSFNSDSVTVITTKTNGNVQKNKYYPQLIIEPTPQKVILVSFLKKLRNSGLCGTLHHNSNLGPCCHMRLESFLQ